MSILVICPNCKNKMKCAPVGTIIGKSKRCVYCGRSFKITANLAVKQ